ncbi:MAG: glycosyltransferase [Syntrophobacteraceae bacterium]|nr:glycosyltransferase [Syntrophobacteraceae bacterium]
MSAAISRVCVVTRTKDRPLMVKRAMESVLNQTFEHWGHIIVNDGGDALTLGSVVSPYLGRYRGRLKIIHNETSPGMQNGSNCAISSTDSEYIAIHDDDDSWAETFLAESVGYLDSLGPADTTQGVATQSVRVFEEIDKYGAIVELDRQDYFPFKEIGLFDLAGKNVFPPIAFVYRRKVHDHIGLFDQQFNYLGDWDFNIRFLSKFDIGVIDRKLAFYHWRHKGAGSNYGNTVTDEVEEHQRLALKLRNHYLRQDLEKGRVGLGFVMNLSEKSSRQLSMLRDLERQTDTAFKKLNYLETMAGHFARITGDLRRFYSLKVSFYKARKRVKERVLGAFSHPGRHPAGQAGSPRPALDQKLLDKLLLSAQVVSFDVFDTVLLRKTKCPIDVFLYMQGQARAILGNPRAQFPELRVNAERISRQRALEQHGYGDTNLEEIYCVLRELTGVDDSALHALKELEICSEKRLIYPNPEAVKLCDMALSLGKTVTFTSDMYLPESLVAQLLEENGFCAENLLISSKTRVTKHSGELFDLVVDKFGGDPGKILHIGDNELSDFERARTRGLQSFHFRPQPGQLPFVDQIASYAGNWVCDLPSSIYTGLARKRRLSHPVEDTASVSDLWKSIGYEVVGPLYLSFVAWVVREAKKLDIEKLFFLARDGYYPIKVFDIVKERWNLAMDARYTYASRRLLNVPGIRAIDADALAFLTEPNPCMMLKDFFQRIGLDPAPYSNRFHDFGFTSSDQLLTTPGGAFVSPLARDNMRKLIQNVSGDILAKAADERSRLLSYLAEAGIASGSAAIVDIGWQASSIKSFRDLLGLNGCKHGLYGLYFSTWRFALGPMNSGCPVQSFYVHLDKPDHRADLIREGVEVLEAFFGAPHPSVVGLEKSEGGFRPLYGEKELDDTQQQYLELAREAALEFVLDACELITELDSTTPAHGYLDTVLERILCHPRPREAHALGQISHRNTFGGYGPLRYIAKVPSGKDRKKPRALREAYERCFWKKGFLAQLTEKEKKLPGL